MKTNLRACGTFFSFTLTVTGQTITDAVPEVKPARRTVSTPATLTALGYLRFESGTLGATTFPEFGITIGLPSTPRSFCRADHLGGFLVGLIVLPTAFRVDRDTRQDLNNAADERWRSAHDQPDSDAADRICLLQVALNRPGYHRVRAATMPVPHDGLSEGEWIMNRIDDPPAQRWTAEQLQHF